jgi:hypothetical protein
MPCAADSRADPIRNQAQLVDTKLEMVCACRLPYNYSSLHRLRWFNGHNRIQRDQIDRSL